MPKRFCRGVNDTDECGVRVRPGLSRRSIFASNFDGTPYGLARIGAPSTRLHSGTFGGRLRPRSSARARPVPSAAPAARAPPPSAAARRRNPRRASLAGRVSGASRIRVGLPICSDIDDPPSPAPGRRCDPLSLRRGVSASARTRAGPRAMALAHRFRRRCARRPYGTRRQTRDRSPGRKRRCAPCAG